MDISAKIDDQGRILDGDTITEKQGYEAMLHCLYDYWKNTNSKDLTDILSGGEYWLEVNVPADSAFWEYWLEAVEKVKSGQKPLMKKLS